MPEMTFTVRWPDGAVQRCYSPSLVVHDHLRVGTTYTVADFVSRSTTALTEAAERVRAAYGFTCTSAAASLAELRGAAAAYDPTDEVEVLRLEPPLPQEVSA